MSKTKTWILLLLLQMFTLTTYAQSTVAEKRVTLNMTQVTMKQLFAEVRKQTGLNFLYNSELSNTLPKITVRAQKIGRAHV